MKVVVYSLWFYFVCGYYVALGENFEAKAWERICRRQLLLDNLWTRIHRLFFCTPRSAPIEVRSLRLNPLHNKNEKIS